MPDRFDGGFRLVRVDQLSDYVLGATSEADFLLQLALSTRDQVPSASSTGIMLMTSGRARYGVGIDEVAIRLERLQVDVGVGPCVEGIDSRAVVALDDLAATAASYGDFVPTALDSGVRSLLSVPLPRTPAGASGTREHGPGRLPIVGALNLYAPVPEAFSAADREVAVELAEQIGSALTLAESYAQYVRLAEQLAQALPSRAVIDQAIGVIISQRHCSPEDGFAVLRQVSQNGNRKLRDVAREVVESQLRS